MRPKTLSLLLMFGGLLATGSAGAVNCYTVLDASDNVVYRGTLPPVDLSDKGTADREAMRNRGQHLIAMDVDRCIGVEYFTGTAGSTTLSVDRIVDGVTIVPGKTPTGFTAPPKAASTTSGASTPAAPAAKRPTSY